ncbi:DUF4157 domain-containing protein [Massilia forsythiae]|uniref:DUF4157 domain-containing protein n=1 Tax=Massilia forsythiae TaxID=2728020 RepID=A0A7Z2VYT9_9BURK|nr:DUF4157 domain-containing protein [Massilia forsythiae]QJE01590.1 DUF4157 domain-containing protein [Massilia forsythiae]
MSNRIIQCNFQAGLIRTAVRRTASGTTAMAPHSMVAAGLGTGQLMPEFIQKKMETVFQTDFSDVRVHQGPEAGAIGALAFTLGSHVYFAPGQYDPHSPQGQALLGHELAHVVQQRAGRVQNPYGGGLAVVEDYALEAEADRMGKLAVTGLPAALPASAPSRPSKGIVQLKGGLRWSAAKKADRLRDMMAEHELLQRQRADLGEVHESDEIYFQEYLAKPKTPIRVYRGTGINVKADSLQRFVRQDVPPKPGDPDVSFYGVLAHTHSNSSPGGMVSTTSHKGGAIEWATDDHNFGLVFEFLIAEYIDVNKLLATRNFRNRYQGQYEFLIPRGLKVSEMKSVTLYAKDKTGKVAEQGWLRWP